MMVSARSHIGGLDAVQTLTTLAELELELSDFYEHLAEMFQDDPQVSQFWLDYSEEETEHASALQTAADWLSAFWSQRSDSRPFIERGVVNKLFRRVKACRGYMRQRPKSLDAALTCALYLETSELNDIYPWAFRSVPILWTEELASMSDGPRSHIMRLCRVIEMCAEDSNLRRRAKRLRNQWEEPLMC